MKINILTYYNEHTLDLLNSLKLSKRNCTDYNITILGDSDEINLIRNNISQCNDFHINIDKCQYENCSLYSALKYALNRQEYDKIFYCESVLFKRDLSNLIENNFGSMLFFGQYTRSNNNLCEDYCFNSKLLYINIERIRIEGILEDFEKFPNNNEEFLNHIFSGRILKFSKPALFCEKENFLKILELNKSNNISFEDFMEESVATEEDEYLSLCVKESYNIRSSLFIKSDELIQKYEDTIVFNFDLNNLDQFVTACCSLLNVIKNNCGIVCLIRNDVTLCDRYYILYKLSTLFRDKFEISFINVDEELKEVFCKDLFEVRGISSIAYARLFIPFLLKNFKSAIYSDCDVLFKRDPFHNVKKFISDKKYIYGVPSIRLHNRNQSSLYINSGFLYFDLSNKELKDDKIKETLLRELENKYIFQDQDIINRVYEGNKGKLPPSFCFIPKCYVNGVYNSSSARKIFTNSELDTLKDPIILHWAGIEKPWCVDVPKGREWNSVNKCVKENSVIEIEEEPIKVKYSFIRSVINKASRSSISKVIGEENMIPKLASYSTGIIFINKLPESFILRSDDYKKSFCCDNKLLFRDDELNKIIKNTISDGSSFYLEKMVTGDIIYARKSEDNISITGNNFSNISDENKDLILDLSEKIYNKFNIYKTLEFVIDKKGKVYFRCIC